MTLTTLPCESSCLLQDPVEVVLVFPDDKRKNIAWKLLSQVGIQNGPRGFTGLRVSWWVSRGLGVEVLGWGFRVEVVGFSTGLGPLFADFPLFVDLEPRITGPATPPQLSYQRVVQLDKFIPQDGP